MTPAACGRSLLNALVQRPKVALNLLDLFTTHQKRP